MHGLFIIYFNLLPSGPNVSLPYLGQVLENTLLALITGYALWKMELWSAGDSKLFLLFSFLLPLNFYSFSYISHFPAFNLLINIFAVSIAAVILKILHGIPARITTGAIRFRWNPSGLSAWAAGIKKTLIEKWPVFIVMFAFFNAAFFAAHLLQAKAKSNESAFLLNVGFLVFMLVVIGKVSSKIDEIITRYPSLRKASFIFILACLYFLIIKAPRTGATVAAGARTIIVFMALVGIVRKALELYLKHSDVKRIKIGDLLPGTVLSIESKKTVRQSAVSGAMYMDGLTGEDITAIREKLPPELEVEVITTIPFAPLAFCGLILTIVIRQSMIHLVAGLLK